MSFVEGLGLHGGDAGEDVEDLGVPGCGDGGVEEEFVHLEDSVGGLRRMSKLVRRVDHGLLIGVSSMVSAIAGGMAFTREVGML